jgi:hypothetical protein
VIAGSNIIYSPPKTCLQKDRLVVADPTALKHILQVAENNFRKPKDSEKLIEMKMGKGLVWAPSGL